MKSVLKTFRKSWERCKSLTWPQTHRDPPGARILSVYPMCLLPPHSVLTVLTQSIETVAMIAILLKFLDPYLIINRRRA